MTLLDAYALIAFLSGGRAEGRVRDLLRAGDAAIPTTNLIEVLDVCERIRGVPSDVLWDALEPLLANGLEAVPLTTESARRAASLRVAHYHRSRRPISLADCVLLASASAGDRIATADAHVLEVARLEGLDSLELPGEDGLPPK